MKAIVLLITLFGLIDWTRLFVPLSTSNTIEKTITGILYYNRKATINGHTNVYVWIFRIARIQRIKPWETYDIEV